MTARRPGISVALMSVVPVCVALVSLVAGCAVSGTPHAASSSTVRAVTYADLLAAPVPELCGHEAGRFANGVLPLQDPRRGPAQIAMDPASSPAMPQVAYGDLTGDGVGDAAMVAECTAGGVGWPPVVNLYTNGDVRLGSVDLSDLPGRGGRGPVRRISISGGRVHLKWLGYRDADASCCPTLAMVGDLVWNGSTVVPRDVHSG